MAADVLTVLRALAEPTRLRVFRALRAKERCVSDLVATEGLSQPLVSHHLRVLAEAGLVTSHRLDGFNMYSVDPDGLAAAKSATGELLDADALAPTAQPGGNPDCCRG